MLHKFYRFSIALFMICAQEVFASDQTLILDGLKVEFTYSERDVGLGRPNNLLLSLILFADGKGAMGIINKPGSATMASVSWQRNGEEIVIAPGQIWIIPGGTLTWQEFHFSPIDSNKDGSTDDARGKASGGWQVIVGDVVDSSQWSAIVGFQTDAARPAASLTAEGSEPALYAMRIGFSQPILAEQLESHVKILANGKQVAGTLRPQGPIGGHVTTATFHTATFLPFDATLSLELADLKTPSGKQVTWDGLGVQTAKDPGSLLQNEGFEGNLQHWVPTGDVQAQGKYEDLVPVQGEKQAVIRSGQRLLGYLDVPVSPGILSFQAAVFSEIGEFVAGKTAVVELIHQAGKDVLFDSANFSDQSRPCNCQNLRSRLGPLPIKVDLQLYSGKRVFISAYANGIGYIGMNEYALVIDDFRITKSN